jgi:hypothetical protein
VLIAAAVESRPVGRLMKLPSPPYVVQQRASDAAFELLNTFAERLTLEQRIRLTVTAMYAPERLGWAEIGDALALWARAVEARV